VKIVHISTASTPENYGCKQVPFPDFKKITHSIDKVTCKNCKALLAGKRLGGKK
jgi:hypothetical protein